MRSLSLGLYPQCHLCSNPVIRLIYDSEHPLDPATLTAIRTVLSAAALAAALAFKDKGAGSKSTSDAGAAAAPPSSPTLGTDSVDLAASTSMTTGQAIAANATQPLLARTFQGVVPAGIELGLYNFLGTSLQASKLPLLGHSYGGSAHSLCGVQAS